MKTKRDSIFDSYLSDDETILWVGRPNPLWLLSWSDIFYIPFSLMWGGFAITWESMAIGNLFSALWGIPFVVVGQYMIWGRFVHKYLRRRSTYYALTDRRAIVLTRFFGTDLKTYFLHQLTSLQRQGHSVLFEFPTSDSSGWSKRRQSDWSGETQPGFYALSDADDVYHLMQNRVVTSKPKHA